MTTHAMFPTMPENELRAYLDEVNPRIDGAILQHLPPTDGTVGREFDEALHYALFPGGKRIRPMLTLLGAEVVHGFWQDALAAATAVEYLHCSSLILDDLPCMDNAYERRGKASLHVRYGEALALLVALALLNAAHMIFLEDDKVLNKKSDRGRTSRAHADLVECLHSQFVGQVVDLTATTRAQKKGADDGESVRTNKTSALMRLALRLGAILSGADERQLAALTRFANLFGEAYQIKDDICDIQEDIAQLDRGRRATFAIKNGSGSASARVGALVAEAKVGILNEFANVLPVRLLCQIADQLTESSSP